MESDLDDLIDLPSPGPAFIEYRISTTTTIRGLPDGEREKALNRYRNRYTGASLLYDDGQGYDIGCQYYKNLHDAEAAEHTDSDEMPALEPVPASDSDDEASPLPTPAATDAMGAPAVPGCDVCANAGTSESTGEGAPASAFSKYPCFSLPPMSPKAQVRAAAEEAELTLEEARRREVWMNTNIGITNGEGVERAWANLDPLAAYTPQMGEGFRQSSLSNPNTGIHTIRIISLEHGVRDSRCNCSDAKHSAYTGKRAHAFIDGRGDIIIKKTRSLYYQYTEPVLHCS
ncbi:hypothetical protein C8R43DRAFT_1128674 [Mycena crocata]|nr:hypothetical protein C8R43DRAFT_1128674 [Mycena crocata]